MKKPRRVRMIEAFNGMINHDFDDGLYIHSADLLSFLEDDRQEAEEETDFSTQEFLEAMIAGLQVMILNRKSG